MSHIEETDIQQTEFKSRKKRQTITIDIVKRIRKYVDKNSSAKAIADTEDLTLPTVYKILNKISEGVSDEKIACVKKGRKAQPFSVVQNKISQILLKDASYTQPEISEELLLQTGIKRSRSSISRILKTMEYSRKRLVIIPEARNTPKNIDSRQNYAREVKFIANDNLVFLDESGFNLHQTRNYGYSPKNMKAYKIVKGSRGTNISCMVAIKNNGVVCYEIKDGSFEGTSFIKFIEEHLCQHFAFNSNDVLVMDNCSFHHRKDVISYLNLNNINYRFLPPYSPQLNPIEEYFSHFKANLQSIHPMARNKDELKSRMRNTLANETIDFHGWYEHMRTYIEKALSRQEFL